MSWRAAAKRPNPKNRITLDGILDTFESTQRVALLDLEEALEELKDISERQYDVVTLRVFGGLQWSDIAEYCDVSLSTAEKDWQAARAWLYSRLRSEV